MKTISLTEQEATLLTQLLKGDQARLILEIAHTDTRDYKDYLKEREKTLEGMLVKLG